jgi:mannosyltransferase
MAKKREINKQKHTPACNLNGDYTNPIKDFYDITPENIVSVITHSKYFLILITLTFIGAVLRLYQLGSNSLWLDEASTYTFASMTPTDIWMATVNGEFNPPLFHWLEHFMLTFGNNEFILRFIPAIFGILTIPLIYFAGKEFIDRNVGIIAAAAFTLSPFLIFYSQEARAYSMMLFFVTFAMVFYFRAIKDNTTSNWLLFGALSALAFWTHFYSFVITAALVLYVLYAQFNDIVQLNYLRLRFIGAIAAFTIIASPLIYLSIKLFASRTSGAPSFGIQGFSVITDTLMQISGFSSLSLVIFMILFIVGIIWTYSFDKNKGIFLILLTVLTFAISMFLSYKMPMTPRYMIFFNTIFFLGVAASYKLVYKIISNPKIVYGFIALIIVLSSLTLGTYYTTSSKDNWNSFSSQLSNVTQPGDLVVAVPGYMYQPLDYYYSNETDGTFEYGAIDAVGLSNITSNNSIYYVVTGDIQSANMNGDALKWLENNAQLTDRTDGIYLFKNRI